MTISIWRYSHLALAVSSFLLLTLASVTGIILSFQPLFEKIQPYRVNNFNELTLAETLPVLRKHYPAISELTVDANQFVKITGSDSQGKKLLAYIDPQTAKLLGSPDKPSEFFQWVTALHRSLFIHEAGRFFIGLTAFLLLLITVSGTMLVIQRQRGLKRFFTRVAKENFAQYWHVVLGRLSLIPIFIIALSGTYLSLERFELISNAKVSSEVDFDAIRSAQVRAAAEFKIFQNTRLSQVETIEFPFSDDVEDYYTLKLRDRELTVNQLTGDILSEVKYPATVLFTNLSLDLHTGRANAIWAIILAIASANILFFIYSGFAMTFKRKANRVKNRYKPEDSRFIILVGSENGSTFRYAQAIHQQLLKHGERSFIGELNHYTVFPKAEYLLVISATYGLGEAPTNAAKFASLIQKYPQSQQVRYSVLGFGSHAYPDFCKFAFEVNQLLARQDWALALTDIHTVNDKSPDEFNLWAEAWSQQAGIPVTVLPELYSVGARLEKLTVTRCTSVITASGTFLISLRPRRGLRINSGDLLAIYPQNDHRERLYSIGVIDKEIRLSVRLHPGGIGSGFLHQLAAGDKIAARIINNTHFHFPAKAPEVIMISNGTGIAPFLGMISQNKKKTRCHLYCGFRERSSFEMYESFLEENSDARHLTTLHLAFSREGEKRYISNLISRDAGLVATVLEAGGVLMICGSLAMQKDLIGLLDSICRSRIGKALSFYQSHGQILSDCY